MSRLEQPFADATAKNQIEGAILQGIAKDGSRYTKLFGNRTLLDGTQKPFSVADLLFLASGTKLLTTIAVLQCCEKSLLSLDGDLAHDLPELVNLGVLVDSDGSEDSSPTVPLRKPLTLRHLITHSSGLTYFDDDDKLKRWRAENPLPKDASNVPTRFSAPLLFHPGEGWMYSTGVDWAGYLVEQVTGVQLDEYFRLNILQSLGFEPTELSFFPVKEGLGDRMPDLNPIDPEGKGLSATMGQDLGGADLTGCFGGSGAYASSRLYVEVLYSILADDGRLLSSAMVADMFKPQLEPLAKESLTAALEGPMGPLLGQDTSGQNRDWGLGGLLNGESETGPLGKYALTWGGGINSAWFIDPANGVCGFASPQLGIPSNLEVGLELKSAFRREMKVQLQGSLST